MKKLMTIGMAGVFAAGFANAQSDVVMVDQGAANDASQTKVTAEAALVSSYVWRGQVYNNDFVVQPQLTVEQYGVSLNVWGNYDLGRNVNGSNGDFSEVDFSLAYTLPLAINEMAFDVGVINYNFPSEDDTNPSVTPSTTEIYGSATVLSFKDYVIPSVTIFGDVRQADGTYVLLDLVAPYQVSDYFAVEGGVSAGYGNTSYNDYYFGNAIGVEQDAGWNDFNFYGNASYEVVENLTVSVNLTYTMLEGGSIEDAAKDIYESEKKFWGGVNVAYDF